MSADSRNILIVSALYPPRVLGGAERSVQFLAEAMVSHGNRVTVVTSTPDSESSVSELNGVTVHTLPIANLYWPFGDKNGHSSALFHAIDICNLKMQDRVGAIMDQVRPDIVHTNTLVGFSVSIWRAARRRRIRIVHTLRDFYLLCPNSKMFRAGHNCASPCFACSVYHAPKRVLSRLVDGVVGNSGYMLSAHSQNGFFAKAKVRTVIHNAYRPTSGTKACGGPESENLRVGYLGRIEEYKGVGLLLDSVARLPAGRVQLMLAGTGEPGYEVELRQRHPNLDLSFLGFIKPENLFAQIDVLAVPSLWHEPLPRVVFEAYTHGLPVIASNRGGLPELVEPGRTGWMFDPGELDSLKKILEGLLEKRSILKEMRSACLVKSQDYRPEVIAESYRQAYEEVLA